MRTRAVIFDLDGVITNTAAVHAAAWRAMFDEFLERRAAQRGEPYVPFDIDIDYIRYVDGKPRYRGVQDFLAARGIQLPYGAPADTPDRQTICGLGNRKDAHFRQMLASEPVEVFAGTLSLIDFLRAKRIPMAIVSSSRNAKDVLRSAGLLGSFSAIVDGVEADRAQFPGKPHPAVFLEAARLLAVAPSAIAVIEDAIAGVEAARQGGFGLVIGIDRAGHASELRSAGADLVLSDLSELDLKTLSVECGT